MVLDARQKNLLKSEIVASLSGEKEIRKIVIFGSFLNSADPHDMDVAIFQDSKEGYLSLAMKYRRITRAISRKIPLDIIPLKNNATGGLFLDEIAAGEAIYER